MKKKKRKAIYIKRKKEDSCSPLMLDMALRCFEHEYDRSKRLESKANIFIPVIGIMFTLTSAYFTTNLNAVWDITRQISIVLFALSGIIYFAGIYNFSEVLKLQEYNLINYKTFFVEEMLDYTMFEMEAELMDTYKGILEDLKIGNDNKADYYEIGLKCTIRGTFISFALMFINFIN
ncbi:hypothetical protein [Romboutsia sp.]|uniref:hypothetical protein n=1 Tax=Romboutsia sp. TaxID=1965302 RepID=UPI003F38356F